MVDSIRGNKGLLPVEPLKKGGKAEAGKGKDKAGSSTFANELKQASVASDAAKTPAAKPAAGATNIRFSPVMQNLGKASEEMDVERTAKLQALKQQIADGNYQPDLTKVAASLLRFVAKGE